MGRCDFIDYYLPSSTIDGYMIFIYGHDSTHFLYNLLPLRPHFSLFFLLSCLPRFLSPPFGNIMLYFLFPNVAPVFISNISIKLCYFVVLTCGRVREGRRLFELPLNLSWDILHVKGHSILI